MQKDEQYWKQNLTPEQYRVLRGKGTEASFTGEYWDNHKKGLYSCAGCGAKLFSSEAKFDSGTGWPSFDEPANLANIGLQEDLSVGLRRTEVICKNCGGHLGHVFAGEPTKTGQRYCINSGALKFEKL